MTAKQFFKSTAFKCIAVLTCVLLVSGILLSIAYGFLEVTDEERFNRKISAVYGGETVTAQVQDLTGKTTKIDDTTIEAMWYIKEKNDYLVQAYTRGYGGNITCWVAVTMQDATTVKGVRKVILYSVGDPAELVSYISNSVYDKFTTDYVDGKEFNYGDKTDSEYINTGASYSMTAICGNVNGAISFVKTYVGGQEEEKDPFEDLVYTDYINNKKTTWEVDGDAVNYYIVTKAYAPSDAFIIEITVDGNGTIAEYNIKVNGCSEGYTMSPTALNLGGKSLEDIEGYLADDTKGGALITGATFSNTLCYEAAAFALANYQACLADQEVTENE